MPRLEPGAGGRWRRVAACAAVALAASVLASAARAQPGLLVGVSDEAFGTDPAGTFPFAQDLGLGAVRLILHWDGAQRTLSPAESAELDSVVAAAGGIRVVLALTGARPTDAPQTDEERDAFCSYAADALAARPTIRDVVIWNEPNTSRFWQPQFDAAGLSLAPAGYEALLARCWDLLHSVRPDANVISDTSARGNDDAAARSNVSHSPAAFIRAVGAAYRASGRAQPIFDTVGHHAYAPRSSDPPTRLHAGSTIAEGDLGKLVGALQAAFAGTAQGVPLRCTTASCPTVWYLESGYQTVPPAEKAAEYAGAETDPAPLTDAAAPTQSQQLRDGLVLAYCQPGVGAYFNFLLADEPDLASWQSGLLFADGTPKSAYDTYRQTIAALAAGAVDCTAPAPPRGGGPVIVVRIR